MSLVKRIVRPFVPAWVREKLHDGRARREAATWAKLDLHRDIAGLQVRVLSLSDWVVFNEIFVERIYDEVIARVLRQTPVNHDLRVLDLGANVGFFALRFSQLVFESEHPDRPFRIDCVEGSPRVFASLSARVRENARLAGRVHVHHGLAGHRSGSMEIYESGFGAGNSIVAQHWSRPVTVPFLNIDALVPPDAPIALLKCDIEGAERIFLDSYPDLVRRARTAVVELHHAYIDSQRFEDEVRALGLVERKLLWDSESARASLVMYAQP